MHGDLAYVRSMALPAERTDAQVVHDVLHGDRDAYRLLVRRYGDVLYAHALHMAGNRDTAADLVQRALVKGYQKLDTCRDPDRVGAWLFRILANQCRDYVRSPRRHDIPLHALPDLQSSGADPVDDVARAEFRRRVRDALEHLTPEQREAFVLRYVQELSYEEIAAVMSTSVAALKMRVHRAREALRGLLEEFT